MKERSENLNASSVIKVSFLKKEKRRKQKATNILSLSHEHYTMYSTKLNKLNQVEAACVQSCAKVRHWFSIRVLRETDIVAQRHQVGDEYSTQKSVTAECHNQTTKNMASIYTILC